MKYHIWTIGCQMNTADSQRLASEIEKLGYEWTEVAEDADVVVLNTCVVRQQAEDKVYGRLTALRPAKAERPEMVIGLMGCLVGHHPSPGLKKQFPQIDVFIPPSGTAPLIDLIRQRGTETAARELEQRQLAEAWEAQDAASWESATSSGYRSPANGPVDANGTASVVVGELPSQSTGRGRAVSTAGQFGALTLPERERGQLVSAHVPISFGCNWVCTFCIIPSRRGAERSRPMDDIVGHVRSLVDQGVREVTLLGQIVDRYGYDWGVRDGLPRLLQALDAIDGLARIRFLTSHPTFMSDDLLDAVAALPKVMEHIEVPVQAGNDEVLKRMKRGYTADDYRALVANIRSRIPNVAIHTDIIVGFCGETEDQFQDTHDLLAELRLDKVHLAKFSSRPGTVAAKVMTDDVPEIEKERRRKALDDLQESVCADINAAHVGRTVEVMVEARDRQRWRGRTRTNKLVYFADSRDQLGRLVPVTIQWSGPWSMVGSPADRPAGPLTAPALDLAIPLEAV